MIRAILIGTSLSALLALARPASAHCDTTRGPVVTDARAALAAGDVNGVLHWVRPEDEGAVRSAFQSTINVRALSPEANELADRYFFETLVRVHRAGEGAPYTGLTDAEPEPIIATTDRALERGSAQELEQELMAAVRAGLAERFAAAQAAKGFKVGDVAGGRAFVAAYVPLTHWVEGVFTSAKGTHEEHPAAPHSETSPAALHPPTDQGGAIVTVAAHGLGARQLVPWVVAGVLAITALVEAAFLLRRRTPATA